MQALGIVHLALAIACLALGGAVFFQRKGGSRHRLLGYLYSGGLLLANVSALTIYEDSSGLGPFHVLALISLATLTAGLVPAFSRRPKDSWLDLHATFMGWSYVGLVAAGVAQMTTTFAGPGTLQVVIPTAFIVLAGGLAIHTRIPKTLSALNQGQGGR